MALKQFPERISNLVGNNCLRNRIFDSLIQKFWIKMFQKLFPSSNKVHLFFKPTLINLKQRDRNTITAMACHSSKLNALRWNAITRFMHPTYLCYLFDNKIYRIRKKRWIIEFAQYFFLLFNDSYRRRKMKESYYSVLFFRRKIGFLFVPISFFSVFPISVIIDIFLWVSFLLVIRDRKKWKRKNLCIQSCIWLKLKSIKNAGKHRFSLLIELNFRRHKFSFLSFIF